MWLRPGSGGQEARTLCGFCGYADAQPFAFCPRCGRPAGALGDEMRRNEVTRPSMLLGMGMGEDEATRPSMPLGTGVSESFGAMPTQPGTRPSQAGGLPNTTTPAGGWYDARGGPYGPSGFGAVYPPGMSAPGVQYGPGPVNGQALPVAPAKRPWGRRKRMSVLAGALLALVLVGSASAYFVYAAFFAYSPTDSARYLPSSTLFYSSFDLQQVAQNSHHVSQQDVAGTTNTSGFEQATGLDFEKDVAPWIKRSFSFALVDVTQQPARGGFGTQTNAGTVFLISTHDTKASNATIEKIITNQEQKYGVKFTTISYQGTTLQSDVDSVQSQVNPGFSNPPATPLVLGIVNDQVIIASTVAVAEGVVDRAKGNGDTLASNATFTGAMGKLPGGRFGTLYVNVRGLLQAVLHVSGSSAGSSATDSYPVGYGSLEFTSVGMRLSFTLEAKAGTHVPADLAGDTNASAGVVPANTLLFAGLGNLRGVYDEVRDGSNGLVTDKGFMQALGLEPDDALFNAPVSVALLPPRAGSDDVVEPLVLLHASVDAATASAKVKQAVETLGYPTSSSTVDGAAVTVIHAPSQTVYYTLLGRDLVFGYDSYGISEAIQTFQGHLSSLAGLATFKALVAQAPKDNALTLFISLSNLANAPGALGDMYRQFVKQDTSLLSKATATYLTYRSDDSGITVTEDIALK